MAFCYINEEIKKSLELFPNNERYRQKWLENQRYLNERGINSKNTGGWLVDGGKFMKDFTFSTFNR